jgi:hypothetical protein
MTSPTLLDAILSMDSYNRGQKRCCWSCIEQSLLLVTEFVEKT